MPPRNKPDLLILGALFFLIALGMVMMFSVSPISGQKLYGDSFYYIRKYFIYLTVGIGAFVLAYRLDYQTYHKIAGPGLVITLCLLLATYIPFFRLTAGGASRWLNLGMFSFQPSEVAKIFVIIYVAHAAEQKGIQINNFWQGGLPIFSATGFITLFIFLQPDLGASVVILSTVLIMLISAGAKIWELLIFALVGIRIISMFIMRTPYQLKRLSTYLDPWKDPLGAGFNTIQSLLAVGSGGILGVGLGQSRQKFNYLPQQFTDFIFAIICEEGGLLLGLCTIIAFAIVVIRGFRAGLFASDQFTRLLAVGAAFSLGFQAVINMMVVTGLLPTKGITLPFISYGGTSLIVSLFLAGLLTKISASSK